MMSKVLETKLEKVKGLSGQMEVTALDTCILTHIQLSRYAGFLDRVIHHIMPLNAKLLVLPVFFSSSKARAPTSLTPEDEKQNKTPHPTREKDMSSYGGGPSMHACFLTRCLVLVAKHLQNPSLDALPLFCGIKTCLPLTFG